MLMIQVVKDQMAQKGSCIQESMTYHRLRSDLKEDNFCGLLIASILSAGILPILLLILPGEGGQDPDHLFGGRNEWMGTEMVDFAFKGFVQEDINSEA